ncbi:hypothetical protein GSI_13832 [Ganoderma sinense ZZ0214-1]|uniref:Uncharacterized protein n=1 Tax=Ganoderma sinense ZZ0214-1 TaxID=1077348 RepID=A0A2G8RRG6_9APHY|nr:hypothetical protein GSI_13832 [Ganoderma sinense ZZ0214-1]
MVAEGISIDVGQLLKLKEHLARALGFAEVAMMAVGNANHFYVRFNSLDAVRETAYPCLNELMLTMDSAQPYSLVSSAMGGRHSDDEPGAPLLVGSIFVDLFLEAFIQCENLDTLPPLVLKNMLKSLIIVIYKHDFDTRPLKLYQAHLRRAVKRALDLLLEELSYDLRQLVLTVCRAFIKRWPHLIGNFVCDAIESTIAVMEKMNYHHNGDDILVEQTKNFLCTTLGLYAFSGVFYLLCKRRRAPEFFAIIKHVVGPLAKAERNPHPHENLRDALLRDTLTRAVEGDDDALQTVIDNVNTYVEVVHHTDYSLLLMQFVGMSLTNLTRKTADLRHARFDPSPLLLLACTLIQHNKANSRDLLLYLETLLRSSLLRSNVSVASLRRVLHVTTTLYRRAAAKAGQANPESTLVNPITSAMYEIARDGLNGKARVTHATLTALIEALTLTPDRGSAKVTFIPLESQLSLAHDGLGYLYHESTADGLMQSDFVTSQAVAKMIMQGAEVQPTVLGGLAKSPITVRVWNVLTLAALSRPSGSSAALLFEHFPIFTLAYCTSLQSYQTVLTLDSSDAQDHAHTDISTAYAAIKLWLLLARKAASEHQSVDASGALQDGEGMAAKMVWNELWPPFETIITAFEGDARSGTVSPLASSVWTSVADLLLFVRQSRSVIALNTAVPGRILDRLKGVIRGESKVLRVVRSLKDAPPDDSLDHFVNQLLTEITAEEKLQAAKRQINMERGRRVAS